MNQLPLVSIIVPNYNHAPYLEQRLESVFGQTFQDFEVILLDDCSIDNSRLILEQYRNHPKVSEVIFNTENSGSPFKQWQKGMSLAVGEYIWIAESDDYCDTVFLEHLVNTIKPGVSIVYTQSTDVDTHGKTLSGRIDWTANFTPNIWENDFLIDGNSFLEKYLWVKNVIPNASAVIFKKALVKEHTFTDALLKMRMCGDWLFWMQLSLNGKVAFSSKALNFFRSHAQTTREHNTLAIKKRRLLEEGEVRSSIAKEVTIHDKTQEMMLVKKWCALFAKKAIIGPEFNSINLPTLSKLQLKMQLFNK